MHNFPGTVVFCLAWGVALPALAQPAQTRVLPAPQVCTEQYAPVCGQIGTSSKTYSNACFAKAAGAKVTADGECKAGPTAPGK